MTSHEEKRREIGWDFDPPELPDDAPAELREKLEALRPKPAPRGTRWLNSLMNRRTVHGLWMSRALVDKDPAKRRSLGRSILLRIALAALCWIAFAFPAWWDAVLPWWLRSLGLPLLFGVSLAALAGWSWNEANTYRRGWLAGRSELRESAGEAQARGMSFEEWWTREQHRDWHV